MSQDSRAKRPDKLYEFQKKKKHFKNNKNRYIYLGSRVTSDGKSATYIRCRIAQAEQVFAQKRTNF